MRQRPSVHELAGDRMHEAGFEEEILIDVAIALWHLERTLQVGTVPDRAKTIVSRLQQRLRQAGFTVEARDGQLYDAGLPLKVVAAVTRSDIRRPVILETTSPSVLKNGRILRAGEVIVANPGNVDGASIDG